MFYIYYIFESHPIHHRSNYVFNGVATAISNSIFCCHHHHHTVDAIDPQYIRVETNGLSGKPLPLPTLPN